MVKPIELGFRPSPQQRRVWRLQSDGQTSCTTLCALRITGDLTPQTLRQALAETVVRHEILRTALRLPAGLSMPLQVILPPGPVSLPEVDFRSLSPEQWSACRADLLADLGRPPLDLAQGEGWRAALIRLAPREHEMLLALSTACADPGTFEPLAADLFATYARQMAGGAEDPEPPLQYADVAEWQNSLLEGEDTAEGVETWREYWREHEIGARITLPLPLAESEAAPGSFAPREASVPVTCETAGDLARLAEVWGCPLPVLVLTAWKAAIQRGTGRDETLVGVLYPGRDAEELRVVVGPLARYLPLAVRFGPEIPLRDAVVQVQQAMAETEPWGDYFSWEHVAGNEAGGFPVCFEAAAEGWELAVDGLRIAPVGPVWNGAVLDSFSLALSCHGTAEGLRLVLRYDPRRFHSAAVHRLAARLATLLGSIAEHPEASLADHPGFAGEELRRWFELSVAPPAVDRGPESETLLSVFAEQANRAPERMAVVASDGRLTFRELDVLSNRLAHHLRAAGAGPEVSVALCLERSAEALVALLAVWKAGAAYVPLDPIQPAERLAYLLEDAGPPLLITDSRLAQRLPGAGHLPGVRTVKLDEEAAVIALRPVHRPTCEAGPHNLAYIIYTSGSTGRPKGVQVEHRSVLHLHAALKAAVLDPLARSGLLPDPLLASLNAPMIFDASVQQLALLLAGHALCVIPQEVRADGAALLAFLREQGVSLLDCTPSQLRLLVKAGLLDGVAGPPIVLTAGEAVDEPLWKRLSQAEGTVCFNLYGPTECSVDATFHRIEPGSTSPTIGRPLAGYEVFVLDRALRPVPPGAPGELCLGGNGLARGYLRRPGLTAERFVPHPFANQPGERLYRTGDLGRHLPDGNLEFLGRLDHQVKIRGFRIELGEIEGALSELGGVRDAVVVARESATGDQRLIAYVAGDAALDSGALRQALRERLPDYMVPAAVVTLAALPLTPNGKVDRNALPAPEQQSADESHVVPRTPVEEILAGIWAEILGLERVGAADNFFDLGGHSLLATQVISRLRNAFGAEISLRALFETPTLADLAGSIEEALQAGASRVAPPLVPLMPTLRQGPLPLSFAQQRLWFIDQLEPGTPLYNIPIALRVEGPLDSRMLALCLGEIVRRHETLRTVFAEAEGEPVQVIGPASPFDLNVVDLSGLPDDSREALAAILSRAEAGRPFDLSRGPLLRCVLLRLAPRDHVAALTVHHIVSDGWSTGILIREVTVLYAAFAAGNPSPLAELPVQYADFAAWQQSWLRGQALEGEISFCRRQLADLPPRLELPTDRPRPAVQSFRGAVRPVYLPDGLNRQAQALSRREGATLFMLLLAGFQALLARFSGQKIFAVGAPVAGRNRVETEGLIGFFVNTLVLRGDLTGNLPGEPSFRESIGRVRETALAAHTHQELPFEKLVQELTPERSLAHTPLFQVMFALQNAPSESLEIQNLRLRPVGGTGTTAKFDLTLALEERNGGLNGAVEYATDLFDASTIDRLIGHFERLLAAALEAPELGVLELPLLSPAERHQLLAEWNDTAVPRSDGILLHSLIEAQAARTPDAPAASFEGETLTYAALDTRADRLARHLRRLGCGPESRVGVALERSLDLIVALLGVLKAGAAYVPLDPGYPRERLAFVLEDAAPRVLITETHLLAALPPAPGAVLCLDGEPLGAGTADRGQGAPIPRDDLQLAYVLYTSGSTGCPKGVGVPHQALVNFLGSMRRTPGFSPGERLLAVTSLGFDIAALEIFLPLTAGGCVELVSREEAADGVLLAARLRASGASVLQATPATWRMLLDAGWTGDLSLRALCGGEALPRDLAASLAGHTRELWNLYGPTETTVWSAAVRIRPEETGPVSIGRPIADTRIHLLDRELQTVPLGTPGELWIGGAGLARGYLGRPDLTAERFLPDPLSGEPGGRLYRTGDLARHLAGGRMEVLGRIDHQVKVRGFRIELGEIEAALGRLAGVSEAVVVARESAPGDRQLVAYVVGDAASAPGTEGALRQSLRERLPDYMVPSVFVMLPALPLTPNGKVDRKALPAPEWQRRGGSHLAPRTLVEEVLAGIWAELLGLERVGIADHFFDLGGHSLLATRVMSRLRSTFGIEMPLRDLFEAPVLADLAARAEGALRTSEGRPARPLAPVPRKGPFPLSFAQQRLWFIHQLEPGSPLYNLPLALRVEGWLDPEVLDRALGEIVRRHEALRTIFAAPDGEPVQVIQSAAPFGLGVVDLSGLPESGRETTALALAAEEAGRPFDLSRGPLLRGVLLRLTERDHVAALTVHHMVSDGWSMGILIREVTALYAAFKAGSPSPLPELPVQYADFSVWQRSWLHGETLESEVSFWRRQLAGLPPLLELPTDHPRPAAQSFRGALQSVRLPAGLTRQLQTLCRREGATLFMALLAGFQILLARYSGQQDLAVGTPVAGRDRMEIEGLIGFFVNTLVLRGDLRGGPSFRELLGRVRETALAAHLHQDVPFEKLVQELVTERSRAHAPLFQVVLALQNAPAESLKIPGLRLRPVSGAGTTAKFDLTLSLMERNGELSGVAEYSTDLFGPATIHRLLSQYERLLTAAQEAPGLTVSELPLLGEAERHQLLAEWGGMSRQPQAVSTLHRRFEAHARHAPEAAALTWMGEVISYGELHRRSNRLAYWLRRQGVAPESRVGLCLERSPDLVVGILGVLKAGGAYVPIDPGLPRERVAYIIEDAGAQLVIGRQDSVAALPDTTRRLLLDTHRDLLEALPSGDIEPLADVASLAYVIYTSGSTGLPKGSLVSHGNVSRLFDATQEWFYFGERDVWTLFHSYAFDFSVWEIWGALLYGGRLVIVPHEVSRSPELFLDLLVRERVTVLNQTPAAFSQLANVDAERGGVATDLRLVIFGGEALDPASLASWFARHGDDRPLLVNMYGITETTVHTTYRPLRAADARGERRSVIGVPIPDISLAVMDPWLRPAPIGVPGELVIGGAGLARGYLGRPELTAERFVPDPVADHSGQRLYRSGDLGRFLPHGDVEYLGRIDHQVKIRGFRIELGEIETLLVAAGAREAVVVAREDMPGDQRLVGYVVGDIATSTLRQSLRERLPDYMVPAAFVTLPALPLTRNGKVDRKALPEPEWQGGEEGYQAPRTPTEEILAGIWADLLGLDRVGAGDHFFDLGGHSLLATRVMSRLRGAFDVELPLSDLFEAPRLADLAARAEAARQAGAGRLIPPLTPIAPPLRETPLPLSFAQQRLWSIDQLEPGTPLYKIPVALRIAGPLDFRVLALCLTEIVRRHEALRTVFSTLEGSPVQVIQPAAPFELPMVDLSGLPESGREATALALAREEAGQPFDLARGPLLRGVLLRLGERDHITALTMHHIVSDGWSMGILVRELGVLYRAFLKGRPSPLPELPLQYADFAFWQRSWLQGEALEGLVKHWRRRLAGAPPRLDLPGARPRPEALSPHGAARHRTFSASLLEQLRALGRRESTTLFMTLLAPLKALLHARTGLTRIVVGTDVAGRDRSETEGLVGFFINQLPLSSDLSGDPTLRELLGRVRETALTALTFQDLPFNHLVEVLRVERSLQHAPVFQVKLVLQNAVEESLELPGLTLQPVSLETDTAQLDLHWSATEAGGELRLSLTYSTDLYDAQLIERLLDQYETWLRAFVERPEARLGEVAAELARSERASQVERDLELKSMGLGKLRGLRQQGRGPVSGLKETEI